LNKRIFFNLLFILFLFWLVLWVWSVAFNTQPWLHVFGLAAYVITGFFLGIIYFFSFNEWHDRIKVETKIWKKILSYIALVLVVLYATHLMILGVIWAGNGLGNLYRMAFWLFVGFVLGAFGLYSKDRLFHGLKELFI
jgi:hypothetical protein